MKKILYSVMALAIAAMTFTACEDVPAPYDTPTGGGSGGGGTEVTYEGEGTLEKPYTVADAIKYAKSFGQAESEKQVYIKGYITNITEEYSTNYGNANFDISDSKDGGNKFTFYRGLYLGNKKFASGDTQIKKGDEVIIYGKVVNYRGNTPETVQNAAYLYSLNGVTAGGGSETPTAEAKGAGTLEDPFNVAAAIAYAKQVGSGESDKEVYIKGKVSKITANYVADNYGNATFYISEDGTSAGEFYCYRTLYLGNQKYTSGKLLEQKDEVIICGKVTCYMGNTPETVQNKSYLYSLNGATTGGGEEPAPTADLGTADAPLNVAKALEIINGYEAAGSSPTDAYVKGKIVSVQSYNSQYKSITYYISDDGTETNQLQVYSGKGLNGADFAAKEDLTVGATVVVKGQLKKYVKNDVVTPEINQNSQIVSIDGNTGGGGTEPGGGGGEVSGNAISVNFSSLGLSNQQKVSTLTLSDGTTLTFDGGGNSNSPAYYNTGTALRMYPKNTMTINAGSKKIAAIEIECNEYSGTVYNASGDITVNNTKMTIDGLKLKFAGPNASTANIANASTTTGAPSQLRMMTLKITYAE